MKSSRAQDILRQVTEQEADQEHALSSYAPSRQADSDNDADAACLIFDSFYDAGGNDAIRNMTNFTPNKFR